MRKLNKDQLRRTRELASLAKPVSDEELSQISGGLRLSGRRIVAEMAL